MIKNIATIFLILFIPAAVYSGVPLDTVKVGVDKIIAVAADPALKGDDAKAAKEGKIRGILGEFFDFNVLSRMTLGKNWKKLNPDQKKEFVKLYRQLLEDVYMDRLLAYSDEKIIFTKETMLSKKKAEVRSSLMRNGTAIPINYRLVFRNDEWKVYDLIIEGVSMVKNYRSQFTQILRKESPEDMLDTLRKKVAKV